MCIKTYVKVAVLSAVLLLGCNTPVNALWGVQDPLVLGKAIPQMQTTVSEVKTQVESTVKLGDISNAIGDPGAALSKFAGDQAAKQLKKVEKAKKQAEKIKKVKEKIEKAKKEYEKKKKQYDEYKDKIEKAKKDYAEAKDTINDAKEVASNAGALAGQALSDAKNQISAKTGGVIGGNSSPNQKTTSQVKQTTSNSNLQAKTTNVNNATAVRTNGINQAVSVNNSTMSRTGVQNQVAGAKSAITTRAENLNQSVRAGGTAVKAEGISKAVNIKGTAVSRETISNITSENKAVIGRRPFARGNAVSKEIASNKEKLSIEAFENEKPLLIRSKEEGMVGTEDSAENQEISEETEAEPESEQNESEAVADKIKNVAAEQGAMEATNMLKTEVRKAIRENDIKTLDTLSKLDKSDIVISDSKKYEEKPIIGRRAFSKPIKPTVQNSVTTPVATQAVRQGEIKENATTLPKQLSAPQPLMKNSVSSSPLNPRKINTIKPKISPDKLDLKATPTMMLQKNSYWEGEENFQNIKMSYAETLRFGDVANDCTDYSYAMQTEKDGETIILPKDLAQKCCIKTEQLKDYNVIQDCLAKFALEMNGHLNPIKAETEEEAENNEAADASIAQDAKAQYSEIMAELTSDNSVFAMGHSSKAPEYFYKVFQPQLEETQKQQGGGATVRDRKGALSMTTQHMANLLNLMRDIEATALMTGSFGNLGNIKEETLIEGKEIGIPAESGEYEASVTIAEGNYPVLPEVIAQRCQIKVSENTDGLKSCLGQVVKDLYATDNKDVEVAQAFIDVVKYQNNLMSMAKGMEQKVRVAEYDEKLNKLQETNEDATTERDGDAANMDVDAENNAMWTEFNRLMASNIASTVLNGLDALTPITSTESKG